MKVPLFLHIKVPQIAYEGPDPESNYLPKIWYMIYTAKMAYGNQNWKGIRGSLCTPNLENPQVKITAFASSTIWSA